MTDAELAYELAHEAGRQLLALQQTGRLAGKELGKEGDRSANDFLMDMLRRHRPDDAILCEEEKDNPDRLGRNRVWVVDPLDGTREFGEGRSDWAVHVALAIDGEAVIGAVALPGLGLTLSSQNPLPPRPSNQPLKMVVSRTRPAAEAVKVAGALAAELLPMGSAGAKAMAVLRGDAELYLHVGAMNEWDSCAPVGVALSHGLVACRFDGSACRYNQPDPKTPDLLIGRGEWVERVRALLPEL